MIVLTSVSLGEGRYVFGLLLGGSRYILYLISSKNVMLKPWVGQYFDLWPLKQRAVGSYPGSHL